MDRPISLLPYIETKNDGFLLDIPVEDREAGSGPGDLPPFQIVDRGQHLSILVKGGLKAGQGKVFKPLFLLVQRDNYPISPEDLNPVTNADVDRIWKETILFYGPDETVFHLPGPPGREDDAAHFNSLFFCKEKRKFFHPPCPECGQPLTLCRDDRLLKASGLFPYYSSLKRYLFCPGCASTKTEPVFYQFARSSEDRGFVRDRFDLIRDFNRLRGSASGGFPCLDCPEHAQCHMTGEKALSRIGFFSFYPFYMLLFGAADLKAVDLFPLISGASFGQIDFSAPVDSGARLKEKLVQPKEKLFLCHGDDRFFLEVLYLKLSFLENFIKCVNQGPETAFGSLVDLSAQSIWISPGSQGNMMPALWNLNLRIIGLVSDSRQDYLKQVLAKNRNLNFIVRLWWHVLLVNREQGPAVVYDTLGQIVGQGRVDDPDMVAHFPVLAPGHIFWEPRHRALPETWLELWSSLVSTGMSLLKEEAGQDLRACLGQLAQEIVRLKSGVLNEMFSSPPSPGPLSHPAPPPDQEPLAVREEPPVLSRPDRAAVADILKSLRDKWRRAGDPDPAAMEDDVMETIVLSSSEEPDEVSPEKRLEESPLPAAMVPEPEEPVLEPEAAQVPEISSSPGGFDEMEETVVLQGAAQAPNQEKGGFDAMEETVVLSTTSPSVPDTQAPAGGGFDEDEDLDKTIIISPKKE